MVGSRNQRLPGEFQLFKAWKLLSICCSRWPIDPTNDKYWPQSLPEIEAAVRAEEKALSSMGMPSSFNPSAENYVASGATLQGMPRSKPTIRSHSFGHLSSRAFMHMLWKLTCPLS